MKKYILVLVSIVCILTNNTLPAQCVGVAPAYYSSIGITQLDVEDINAEAPIVMQSRANTFSRDTVIIRQHPNSADSVFVATIVNGVVTVSSQFIQVPLINYILKSQIFGSGLIAIILAIWRRRELRKLREKGFLIRKS